MAHGLYNTVATGFSNDPKGWASTAPAHVLSKMVAYSLRQLSEWLSSGGMALGAPPFHACMISCNCAESAAFAGAWYACMRADSGSAAPALDNAQGVVVDMLNASKYMATNSNSCLCETPLAHLGKPHLRSKQHLRSA